MLLLIGRCSAVVTCLVVVCVVRWCGLSTRTWLGTTLTSVSGMCAAPFVLGGVISMVWLRVDSVVCRVGTVLLTGRGGGAGLVATGECPVENYCWD